MTAALTVPPLAALRAFGTKKTITPDMNQSKNKTPDIGQSKKSKQNASQNPNQSSYGIPKLPRTPQAISPNK